MMFQYKCLNPISPCGTSLFTEEYKQVEELQKADAVLVRSAAMHDMQDVLFLKMYVPSMNFSLSHSALR